MSRPMSRPFWHKQFQLLQVALHPVVKHGCESERCINVCTTSKLHVGFLFHFHITNELHGDFCPMLLYNKWVGGGGDFWLTSVQPTRGMSVQHLQDHFINVQPTRGMSVQLLWDRCINVQPTWGMSICPTHVKSLYQCTTNTGDVCPTLVRPLYQCTTNTGDVCPTLVRPLYQCTTNTGMSVQHL